MKSRKSKLENPETRRSFIKSAGMLIGTFAISGAGHSSSVLFSNDQLPVSKEKNDEPSEFFDIHLHGSLVRHP